TCRWGNVCHRGTNCLTEKRVGPTSSLGIIAGDCIPDEDSPATILQRHFDGDSFPQRHVAGESPDMSLEKAPICEWSISNAKNLSRILTCFHLASGLKVNFNKSKIFGIGVSYEELNVIVSTLGCLASQFLCTYLGLPIGAKMSRCRSWEPLIKRQNIMGAWDKVVSPRNKGGLGGVLNSNSHKKAAGTCPRIINLKHELTKVGINLPTVFKKKIGDGRSISFWHDHWNSPMIPQEDFLLIACEISSPPCQVTITHPTLWNKLLPSKVNIFTWRVLNKRLPTRLNLDRRGIDLDTVRCPLCNNDIETKDHIFVKCPLAIDTWKVIFSWWQFTGITNSNLLDILTMADASHGS
ncbi:RNA-directed DNA polymerase, eukaryota, reverse transcriptase zinc-binding domain protein, partial [Tanacetum coccineum]